MTDAIAAFDEVGNSQGVEAFGLYHKALALASVGDFEGAAEIFDVDCTAPITDGHRDRANSLLPEGIRISPHRLGILNN